MKIGVQTWGSDGDIRPLLALAGGLSAAGHEVTLVVTSAHNKNYTEFADRLKLRIIHTANNFHDFDPSRLTDLAQRVNRCHGNAAKELRIILENFFFPVENLIYSASRQLCRDHDLVVGHFLLYPLQIAAAKAAKPHATVTLNHGSMPSADRPPTGLPDLGPRLNPAWWWLAERFFRHYLGKQINRRCQQEGLPPFRAILDQAWESHQLALVAVSPVFSPETSNTIHRQVCGFLHLDKHAEPWAMPEALNNFLAAGPPPIYMTFGSLSSAEADPGRVAAMMIQAARKAGCRAIIQHQWQHIAGAPHDPDIFRLTWAPHQYIFPHCAAIVHHGGAGTTHSACRAGRPSVVVQHFGDQRFWGKELARLHLAPPPLARRTLKPDRLGRLIRTVLDDRAMGQTAARFGAIMQQEDGVSRAVRCIDQRFGA